MEQMQAQIMLMNKMIEKLKAELSEMTVKFFEAEAKKEFMYEGLQAREKELDELREQLIVKDDENMANSEVLEAV
jgi:hypothetical protein